MGTKFELFLSIYLGTRADEIENKIRKIKIDVFPGAGERNPGGEGSLLNWIKISNYHVNV